MARTSTRGKRQGKTGSSVEQCDAAAPSLEEDIASAAPVLGPMPIDRGHETLALADREMLVRGWEGSAVDNAPGRDGPPAFKAVSAPVQTRHRLQGQIDTVDWAAVNGWVWDPNRPGKRIRLELVDGETPLLTTVASSHRPELARRGIGDGGYGFSIRISKRGADGRPPYPAPALR